MGIKKPNWQLKAASAIRLRSQSPNVARGLLKTSFVVVGGGESDSSTVSIRESENSFATQSVHSGSATAARRLPLLGAKRTSRTWLPNSVHDPEVQRGQESVAADAWPTIQGSAFSPIVPLSDTATARRLCRTGVLSVTKAFRAT